MAKKKRSAEKEAFWRGILKEFSESSETVRKFCMRVKVSEQSFYSWRREISRRDQNARKLASPALVSVNVVDVADSAALASRPSSSIEILTRDGLTLRVDDSVGVERLREVLDAIEGLGVGAVQC